MFEMRIDPNNGYIIEVRRFDSSISWATIEDFVKDCANESLFYSPELDQRNEDMKIYLEDKNHAIKFLKMAKDLASEHVFKFNEKDNRIILTERTK